MKVIRVTKNATNRIDAIFVGQNMLFVNPDFGLIALARLDKMEFQLSSIYHYWSIELTKQISKGVVESVIKNFGGAQTKHFFKYTNEQDKPMHTLPYNIDIKLESQWKK